MKRACAIPIGLLLALVAVNGLIAQKESVLSTGERVYLRLAPADPRSLMQGDYMRLDYAGLGELWTYDSEVRDGFVVVRVGEHQVATPQRLSDGASPLGPDELRIRYRVRDGSIRMGSGDFFFQEGQAELYEEARYAELRVSESGQSVLVGLADAKRHHLGPPFR